MTEEEELLAAFLDWMARNGFKVRDGAGAWPGGNVLIDGFLKDRKS